MMARPCAARHARQAQRGQALVLGLLLLGVLATAFMHYAAVSRLTGVKAGQLHALDAAVYSGALVQARAMNMLAHVNRAQLGHQVAMAHLTALGAWAGFGATQASRLAQGNPPAHLIGMLFGVPHGQAYLASAPAAGLQADVSALQQAHAQHDHVVHSVLQTVQQHIVQGLAPARRQAIEAVLARHDGIDAGHLGSGLQILHDQWPGYLRQHSGRDYLAPFLRRVMRAYPFLSPRNHTARNTWAVSARCPWLRHQLRRRGETRLDAQGRWQSIDTQSYHALRSNRWVGCYYREYAMAWAWVPEGSDTALDAPHVSQPPDDFASQDFWRWVQEFTDWDMHAGSDNPLANSFARRETVTWGHLGLGRIFDVEDSRRGQPVGFQARLRLPDASGRLITTHSAAETYFVEPPAHAPRQTSLATRAHVFLPYWQARLKQAILP